MGFKGEDEVFGPLVNRLVLGYKDYMIVDVDNCNGQSLTKRNNADGEGTKDKRGQVLRDQ